VDDTDRIYYCGYVIMRCNTVLMVVRNTQLNFHYPDISYPEFLLISQQIIILFIREQVDVLLLMFPLFNITFCT